jgi:uncharacterized protein
MKVKKLFMTVLTLLALILFLFAQNNMLQVTKIDLQLTNLPGSFDGLRIVHLSDLHSKEFGRDQKALASRIAVLRPDLILITGDFVDSRYYSAEKSLKLTEKLVSIAPVYFTNGNHEARSGKFSSLESSLKKQGVRVLRNESELFRRNTEEINIIGIDDPSFSKNRTHYDYKSIIGSQFNKATEIANTSAFSILLSHRPDLFPYYADFGIDLIFSGHAHGGQVRLPFIGGLVAPNQGFFPKYTSGKYIERSSTMVVSRGLGNSIFPQRIFNRPQIIVVTLKRNY